MPTMEEILDKTDLTTQVKNNILSKTKIVDEHWLYEGSLSQGYIRVYYKYRLELLGRIILDITNTNFLALHKTTCSHTNCWNPYCLYAGSRVELFSKLKEKG